MYRWGNQFKTTWKCTCRNGSKEEEPKGRTMDMKHLLLVWLMCQLRAVSVWQDWLIWYINQLYLYVDLHGCWIFFLLLENLCERGGGRKLMQIYRSFVPLLRFPFIHVCGCQYGQTGRREWKLIVRYHSLFNHGCLKACSHRTFWNLEAPKCNFQPNLHFCKISFPGFFITKRAIELGYLQFPKASLLTKTVLRHINKQQRVAHVCKAVEYW